MSLSFFSSFLNKLKIIRLWIVNVQKRQKRHLQLNSLRVREVPEADRAPDRNLSQNVDHVESAHHAGELGIVALPRLDDGLGLPLLDRADVARAREGVDEHSKHKIAAHVRQEDDGADKKELRHRRSGAAVAKIDLAARRVLLHAPVQARPVAHEGDAHERVHRHRHRCEVGISRNAARAAVDVLLEHELAEELRREDGEGEDEDGDDGEDAAERHEGDAEMRDERRERLAAAEDLDDADQADRPEDGADARVDHAAEDEARDGRDGDEEVKFVPLRRDVDGEGLAEDLAEGLDAEENGKDVLEGLEDLAVRARRREDLYAEDNEVGDGDDVASDDEPGRANNIIELFLDVAIRWRAIEARGEISVISAEF